MAEFNSHRVQRFTADGQFVATWGRYGTGDGQFDEPISLAVAPDGTVYVADRTRIQRFTPDGRFIGKWASYNPLGVAVAPDSSVYVTPAEPFWNPRTARFTADGAPYPTGERVIPTGLEVDVGPDGSVYVAEPAIEPPSGSGFARFTAEGRLLGKWGTTGSGDGQFSRAFDAAAAADGTVYVTDQGNHRIQRFGQVDVYLRDHVGDGGDPHTGAVSRSPDIIVRMRPVADPQASFGQGSGTEANEELSEDVVWGLDNHLYARVLNRGQAPAKDTSVSIYWSEPATLVTPNAWKLIGTASLPTVEPGNLLTVSPAVTWTASAIPAPGHYCFVGVLANQLDPAPDLAPLTDWDSFVRFIQQQNNVTWRNFNVIMILEAKPVELPFIVAAAPQDDVAMDFELAAENFPKRGQLWLDAPEEFADWAELRRADLAEDGQARRVKIPAKEGKLKLRRMKLPAGSRAAVKALVHPPPGLPARPQDIVARQVYDGIEVGRVTWRLRRARPGPAPQVQA